MKNQLLGIIVLALLTFTACKNAESSDATANEETTEVEKTENADNSALFKTRMEVLRSYVKAHSAEDLETLSSYVSDTLKWSPPSYSENSWLGKEEYMAALKGYHDNYDNISYAEGIILPNATGPGYFSGNAYSADGTVNTGAAAIRCYGTWHATHVESGKKVGVKWFGVASFNDDNQIAMMTEYWDVNGLAAQIAAD